MLIDGLAKKCLEIGPECENEYSQFTKKKNQLVSSCFKLSNSYMSTSQYEKNNCMTQLNK